MYISHEFNMHLMVCPIWIKIKTCRFFHRGLSTGLQELFFPEISLRRLRKQTMVITNAPWMSSLPIRSMTPERRLGNSFPPFVFVLSHAYFLSTSGPPMPREELYNLQSMKKIRMVRKYRDSKGERKVVLGLLSSYLHMCA